MSMPAWLNDAHSLPNGDHGSFNHTADQSMAFLPNTSTSLDYTQLQQNGSAHNGPQNTIYPTQSLVPSKRPRPREDSVAASPGQTPGHLPATRSQTPQQGPYPGFQGSVNGNHHFQGGAPYQQFANSSSTTSPSPVMQNQMFNPQALPQRMQTGSPALFSPPPQNFGSQASPVSSEHGSRNNTPQNGGQAYPQNLPFAGNPGHPFNPSIAGSHPGVPMTQYNQAPQTIQQQQRMHEIRQQQLMRQLHSNNNAVQSRHPGVQMNPPAGTPAQMANYQTAARAQQAQAGQQAMMRPSNPEQFVRSVGQFMQQRGLAFNPNPTAAGRPINLYQLFYTVLKQGGSKRFTTAPQWAQLAANFQVPQQHLTTAAQELHAYWQTNLAGFESLYVQQQQQRQRVMNEQMRLTGQNGDPASLQGQWSPGRHAVSQSPGPQLNRQMASQMPATQDYPNSLRAGQSQDARQSQQNGYLNLQQTNPQSRQFNPNQLPQSNLVNSAQNNNHSEKGALISQTVNANATIKEESRPPSNRRPDISYDLQPRQKPLSPEFSPSISPKGLPVTHGGLQVVFLNKRPSTENLSGGNVQQIDERLVDALDLSRPWVPFAEEFGLIDIRALILSLRSGLHAEVRLALDTFARLSTHRHDIPDLHQCEDLVETLIESADEQVDVLIEHATEVSDEMLINPYDEMVRGCAVENQTLQEVPKFGTTDYELDRAVSKLLCITTILRNFSFTRTASPNRLAEPVVLKFITTVIRYLGTRNMLLRTHQNTLRFSKDIITFLSNIAQEIDLPGREEALCILQFLLSFAPLPAPINTDGQELTFTHYNPAVHRYYPLAVDILAKLLARDEPNRTFYRSIFLGDSASLPPFETLTRTFGLAIAGIPIYNSEFLNVIKNPDRMPTLAQGLLAAEILSGFIPGSENSLARSWITAQDNFAASLVEIVLILGDPAIASMGRYPPNQLPDPERSGSASIVRHGIAVLLKLAEKAKDPEDPASALPSSVLPKKKRFLEAMRSGSMNGHILRQLCIYSGMQI